MERNEKIALGFVGTILAGVGIFLGINKMNADKKILADAIAKQEAVNISESVPDAFIPINTIEPYPDQFQQPTPTTPDPSSPYTDFDPRPLISDSMAYRRVNKSKGDTANIDTVGGCGKWRWQDKSNTWFQRCERQWNDRKIQLSNSIKDYFLVIDRWNEDFGETIDDNEPISHSADRAQTYCIPPMEKLTFTVPDETTTSGSHSDLCFGRMIHKDARWTQLPKYLQEQIKRADKTMKSRYEMYFKTGEGWPF